MEQDDTTEVAADVLSGIPGIGPARKAALRAAGIMTRAALARASVEQLVSLTGMPRAQAEKALASLPVLNAPAPQAAPPLADEAMPPDTPRAPDADADADTDHSDYADHDAHGLLDRAAFRTKTALSDATRVGKFFRMSKSLARLAAALDSLTEPTARTLRPKVARRLAARLEDLAAWIEKAIRDERPSKQKKQAQVRQRLKSERGEIEKTVAAAKTAKGKTSRKPAEKAGRGKQHV